MAITFEELQDLVKKEGLRFFVDPDDQRLMVGVTGMCGKFQLVISLYDDGVFLQVRSVNYLNCPPDHPALGEVLQAIADVNYQTRLVKFAWDRVDGEIVAYADAWLMDASLTQDQLHRILGNYVPAIDLQSYRLKKTMQEGKDPGRIDPATLAKELLKGDTVSPEIRAILEEAAKEAQEEGDDEVDSL
ncbi:MAG: YbjN domain-containing protein [Planctomycetes bacterium]|nr:YbjN domain-containing protein [Planctomycetota bacterium]